MLIIDDLHASTEQNPTRRHPRSCFLYLSIPSIWRDCPQPTGLIWLKHRHPQFKQLRTKPGKCQWAICSLSSFISAMSGFWFGSVRAVEDPPTHPKWELSFLFGSWVPIYYVFPIHKQKHCAFHLYSFVGLNFISSCLSIYLKLLSLDSLPTLLSLFLLWSLSNTEDDHTF